MVNRDVIPASVVSLAVYVEGLIDGARGEDIDRNDDDPSRNILFSYLQWGAHLLGILGIPTIYVLKSSKKIICITFCLQSLERLKQGSSTYFTCILWNAKLVRETAHKSHSDSPNFLHMRTKLSIFVGAVVLIAGIIFVIKDDRFMRQVEHYQVEWIFYRVSTASTREWSSLRFPMYRSAPTLLLLGLTKPGGNLARAEARNRTWHQPA
jgi:hypothetical protein